MICICASIHTHRHCAMEEDACPIICSIEGLLPGLVAALREPGDNTTQKVHTHSLTHTHTHTYNAILCVCTHTHIQCYFVCMYVCMYVCICACVHIHTNTRMHTYSLSTSYQLRRNLLFQAHLHAHNSNALFPLFMCVDSHK